MKRDTRFKPGQSGNPAGRPKSASVELRQALAKHGHQVLGKVVEAALAGDMAACRMILDRLAPPLKATAAPVSIDLPSDAGLAGTARAFIDAAATGKLPPDVAAQMVASVGHLARVVEIDELARRVAALEAAL